MSGCRSTALHWCTPSREHLTHFPSVLIVLVSQSCSCSHCKSSASKACVCVCVCGCVTVCVPSRAEARFHRTRPIDSMMVGSMKADEVKAWLMSQGLVIEENTNNNLQELLRDGLLLCQLANRLRPRSAAAVRTQLGVLQNETVSFFLIVPLLWCSCCLSFAGGSQDRKLTVLVL